MVAMDFFCLIIYTEHSILNPCIIFKIGLLCIFRKWITVRIFFFYCLEKNLSDIFRYPATKLTINYKRVHAFLFIRIVFFRFNMDILNFWANIILIYS